MKRRTQRAGSFALILAFAAAASRPVVAQDYGLMARERFAPPPGPASAQRASEYVFQTSAGQSLIAVTLLGEIANPGLYYVPAGTDFVTLLALAGGLSDTADTEKVLYRPGGAAKTKSREVDLKPLLDAGATRAPQLAAQDLIYVPQKEPWISNNLARTLTVASVVVGILVSSLLIYRTVNPSSTTQPTRNR